MTAKRVSGKAKTKNARQTKLTSKSTGKKTTKKTVKSTASKSTRKGKSMVRDEKQIALETNINLKEFGIKIYNDLLKNKFPEVEIPVRSAGNSIYDETLRQYVIGSNTSIKSSKNPSQLQSLVRMVWLAGYIKDELVKNSITGTLRDIYYASMNQPETAYTEGQDDSNQNIKDLEACVDISRDDLNIFAKSRGKVFGNLVIEYTKKDPDFHGKKMDLSANPKGVDIDQDINTALFSKTKADKVIVVEKNAVFNRFIEDKVAKKQNAILVGLGGQTTRADRVFIKRLSEEAKLPVYVFTDGDIYGLQIALVLQSGSSALSYVKGLAVPDAKWCGIWASEFKNYNFKEKIKATPRDIVKSKQMLEDPRFKKKSRYYKEVELFIKNKEKVELEVFSQFGPRFISEEYLPKKIKEVRNMNLN